MKNPCSQALDEIVAAMSDIGGMNVSTGMAFMAVIERLKKRSDEIEAENSAPQVSVPSPPEPTPVAAQ